MPKISNSQYPISNEISNATKAKVYDLEERTARFGESVIAFAKKIPKNEITRPIVIQLVKAGTSVGANYCEADCAESRKDFEHKIGICKKEAKETKHWLRMISTAVPDVRQEARMLWKEANELQLIFITTVRQSRKTGMRKKVS